MTTDEMTDEAVAESMKLARGMFALRGNHSEMHVSEEELASQLAVAFKRGVRAAIRKLQVMVEEGK